MSEIEWRVKEIFDLKNDLTNTMKIILVELNNGKCLADINDQLYDFLNTLSKFTTIADQRKETLLYVDAVKDKIIILRDIESPTNPEHASLFQAQFIRQLFDEVASTSFFAQQDVKSKTHVPNILLTISYNIQIILQKIFNS